MSPRRRAPSEDGGRPAISAAEREHIRRGFLGLALCHELKQPLHSLNLNVELLTKRMAKAGVNESDFSGPMGALGRVVDRINDCLDSFSARVTPDAVTSDEVSIVPILGDAVERVRDRAKRAGLKVNLQVDDDLPQVAVNSDQLAVALDALLDNALRASSTGGEVLVSATQSDEDVRIEITDRGTGMPPEVLRRAVEIGYTTWGGAGVGLTVAKFITYHHAGGFQVSSTPGEGTTVSMTLPVGDLRD